MKIICYNKERYIDFEDKIDSTQSHGMGVLGYSYHPLACPKNIIFLNYSNFAIIEIIPEDQS